MEIDWDKPVLKYKGRCEKDIPVHSTRVQKGYEEDFKILKNFLYKTLTVKEISELTGINENRIYNIFKFKGLIYDSNIGKTFITKRQSTLTITELYGTGSKYKDKVYTVHCSNCSKDTELFQKPFTSTIERLNLGKAPCACSGRYEYSNHQKRLRVVRTLKGDNYILRSIGKKTFSYDCLRCGVKNRSIRYNRILNGDCDLNCKCSKHYQYENLTERLSDLKDILSNNNMNTLTPIDYNQKTRKYTFSCSKCASDEELWGDVKLYSTKEQILKGQYPCGCKPNPFYSKKQYEVLVTRRCKNDGFVFNGFVGEYLKTRTLISITCQNGHTRNTTMVGQFLNKNTNRCVECKPLWARELYASDCEEIKNILLNSLLPHHKFLGFCGGEYINQNQKFKYFCSKQNKVYKRTIRSFLDGSKGSCCSGGGFKENLKGYLYLVKWFDESNGFHFYKYGISNHNPLKRIKTQSNKTKYTPVYLGGYLFDKGSDAVLLENHLKVIYGTCKVSFEDLPDGYTETIHADEFTNEDLLYDFISLTGIDVFSGKVYTRGKEDILLAFKGGFKHVTLENLTIDLGGDGGKS